MQKVKKMGKNKKSVQQKEKILSYQPKWNTYPFAFSNFPQHPFRFSYGSFLDQKRNYVQIVQFNQANNFEILGVIEDKYPANKILFNPDSTGTTTDLVATSGQNLKLYKIANNREVELALSLRSKNQFCLPLTSIDWSQNKLNLILTSSIDTACTFWDLQKASVYSQILTHQQQVNDASFSRDENVFGSVGSDGTFRAFDFRILDHSVLSYSSQNSLPIVKMAWNLNETKSQFVALIEFQSDYITIIDTRYFHPKHRRPGAAYSKLRKHKSSVNAIKWAPHNSEYLCSVGEDHKTYIWQFSTQNAILEYNTPNYITNLDWSKVNNQWIGINYDRTIELLQL